MQLPVLGKPGVIIAIMVLQFIPLLLFPPYVFSPVSQQWWLPVLLSLLALWASIDLMVRRGTNFGPWNLIAFSHGFNIISRLMMIMPHATWFVDGVKTFNTLYVVLSIISMVWSGLMLTYIEKPEIRLGLVKTDANNA